MKKTILATLIISIFFAFTCTASATTSGGQTAAKSTPAPTDTVSLSNDTVMPAAGSGVGLVFNVLHQVRQKHKHKLIVPVHLLLHPPLLYRKNPAGVIRKLPLHQKPFTMSKSTISNISL